MNRIKQLREEKGWTQEDLGHRLKVQKSAVSKYETGRVPLTDETIKKLVEIFDESADYILCTIFSPYFSAIVNSQIKSPKIFKL